ncbi:IpaD/SipD/SspD family type III secretion system needle tip protein [Robbsia andropogonis]|uniref:IpaD/SipD/SspD family type III secretion system needle tip protein n=1 Tax=Robbsia andropogonis TaxID=28092 RepID=UPI003D1BEBE4
MKLDSDLLLFRNPATWEAGASRPTYTDTSPSYETASHNGFVYDLTAFPGKMVSRMVEGMQRSGLYGMPPALVTDTGNEQLSVARGRMIRVLSAVGSGETANVPLALQAHRTLQTQAVMRLNALFKQAGSSSTDNTAHRLRTSTSAVPSVTDTSSAQSTTSTEASSKVSSSDDPDTSTPAAVDAITINSLDELKAYYATYAADYKSLTDYITQNYATDPADCEAKAKTFMDGYGSKTFVLNSGIDPSYAMLVLGNAMSVSNIDLPGKGQYQVYRFNAGVIQDYVDDQAFCDRLKQDVDVSRTIWNATAGHDRAASPPAPPPPTYDEVYNTLQMLEKSFACPSHVSSIPPDIPNFYTIKPDPTGGYIVTPSDKFKEMIDDCNTWLAAWKKSGDPVFNQDNGGEVAQKVYGESGSWIAQNPDNSKWVASISQYTMQSLVSGQNMVDQAMARMDELQKSDVAQYGGLKTSISEAKEAIIDPYGQLVSEYMNYTQAVTDVMSDLSSYVTASDDGSKVTFKANELRDDIQAKLNTLSSWSITLPGTAVLSSSDWSSELKGNFKATPNPDGTTTLTLDLTNLQGMHDSLANYSDGDISVTQYNAWYSGFSSQKDNVQNLSQSIAEKFSKMNTTFDDLVRVMSSTITALLEAEQKSLQF